MAKLKTELLDFTEELEAILLGPAPADGIRALDESGRLAVFLPELVAMKGIEQKPEYHPEGDVWVHTLKVLDNLPENVSIEVALAALLHDIGKPLAQQFDDNRLPTFHGHERLSVGLATSVLERLCFEDEVAEVVLDLVGSHMKFQVAFQLSDKKLKKFVSRPHFDKLMELHRADAMGGCGKLDKHAFLLDKAAEVAAERVAKEAVPEPVRLVTGNDLIEMGLKPSPRFTQILNDVNGGDFATREDALAYLLQYLSNYT